MKKYMIPALLALGGCETAAEISAREQIDAACMSGDIRSCALVEKRVAARNRDSAIIATAPIADLRRK